MKKIILLATFAVFLLSCSRSKSGDVTISKKEFIMINGKIYNLAAVTPCNDCHAIWILYPQDSTVKMPIVTNFEQLEGKRLVNKTAITILE